MASLTPSPASKRLGELRFDQKRSIAVVGDLMVDQFGFGEVSRVSPEAPVPVLRVNRRESRLGGAANVANNIKALGGQCCLVGLTGPGDELPGLLEVAGIDARLVRDERYTPVTKFRAVAQNQQLLRIDEEDLRYSAAHKADEICAHLSEFDLIIVSDYDKGTITPELMSALRQLDKMVLVDPKRIAPELYRGVFLLKPNVEETRMALGKTPTDDATVACCARTFHDEYGCHVLITRGGQGMSLCPVDEAPQHFPTEAREVYDVTGAGDTVIATLGLALACEFELSSSARLANAAAGVVVGKMGTATTNVNELAATLSRFRGKTRTREELAEITAKLRAEGRRIVFTNGCFDILHAGHARLLSGASALGDVLILGINSDASVARLKGPSRPINTADDRAEILSCLESVDFVTVFEEDDPCALIAALKPDVHVKGGDYDPEDQSSMPEASVVRDNGGDVVVIPLLEGRSTTTTIKKVSRRD